MTYIQEMLPMCSMISRKLSKLIDNALDKSYMVYQEHADRSLTPFLKSLLKRNSFHPKSLLHIALFRINKHKYIINKRDIFNSLVALEQSDQQAFLNSSGEALADLFKSSPFDKPVGGMINSTIIKELQSGVYINPFTNQPIELSIRENSVNQCIRFASKYLFVGQNDMSTVVLNQQDITDIADLMRMSDDMANKDDIIKEYTIYHELSHDSHFQNYRLYKDAVKMGVDIPHKTKILQEIESDVSSILYIIKDRKLTINEAFEVINGVMNFRCGTNYKTLWDSSLKSPTEETIHYHITQPALLILTRMINDEGVKFIHSISCLAITNIAYHIANLSDEGVYHANYKSLLPVDKNEFKKYLLDNSNENLVFFYLLSYFGAEIMNFTQSSLELRKSKFNEMADKLIEKLYSDKEIVIHNSLYFRTLVAFQYAVNINPEKIQSLYLSETTKELADSVYNNYLERLVFEKNIEIEHTRHIVKLTIK